MLQKCTVVETHIKIDIRWHFRSSSLNFTLQQSISNYLDISSNYIYLSQLFTRCLAERIAHGQMIEIFEIFSLLILIEVLCIIMGLLLSLALSSRNFSLKTIKDVISLLLFSHRFCTLSLSTERMINLFLLASSLLKMAVLGR